MDIPKEIQEQLILPEDPTQRPQLKPRKCPDCDLVVQDRIVQHRITSEQKWTYKHTKQKCSACKLVRDPVTGEFCWDFAKDKEAATKHFYALYHK